MTKLELLYAQKSEKFGEVCAVAARELGYGEPSTLSVEDRIRVEDEAKLYVEQWEETVEMRTNFTIRPVTPLRHLLAEYHDICERILVCAGGYSCRCRLLSPRGACLDKKAGWANAEAHLSSR